MSRPQSLDRPVVRAVEKRARQRDALHVRAHRARRDARAETLLRPRGECTPACAAASRTAPAGRRNTSSGRASSRAGRARRSARAPPRRRAARRRTDRSRSPPSSLPAPRTTSSFGAAPRLSLMNAVVPRVTLHRDVEPRPQSLDQPQLLEQRRELARRVLPLDVGRLAQNPRALFLGIRAAEVAEQPRAHALRLADVHDLAVWRQHAIDAGPVLRAVAHERRACARAPSSDVGARGSAASALACAAEHRRSSVDRVRRDEPRPQRGHGWPSRPYACELLDERPRSPDASR